MSMGRGIASMGKSQGGMRQVQQDMVSMAKAVDASWWLSGGIDPATVAGVWQPKGAASLAASYLRLAGNEGYADIDPAVVGGVAPTWTVGDGWVFNTHYLNTGIVPTNDQSWSAFVQVTKTVTQNNNYPFGAYNSANQFFAVSVQRTVGIRWANGATLEIAPVLALNTPAVLGFSGATAYKDGSFVGNIPAGVLDITIPVYIGTLNGVTTLYYTGTMAAIAIYKSTLTAAQVLAVSTAMAAL